jgi:hypothetical protein
MKPRIDDICAACWKPSPDIASRKVANEIVLLNVKTSEYYSMNPTAVRVWELIGKNKKFDEIVAAIAEEFESDGTKVGKDVLELVNRLESEKIVTRVP